MGYFQVFKAQTEEMEVSKNHSTHAVIKKDLKFDLGTKLDANCESICYFYSKTF